jgi:hypothetical protein
MNRWMTVGIAGAATMAFSTPAALAQSPSATSPPGDIAQKTPVKDCTRFNGHFGFYGNPWCTPEEQARWDKYEAERLRAVTGGGPATRL